MPHFQGKIVRLTKPKHDRNNIAAYCVRCQAMINMSHPTLIERNNRKIIKGRCPRCNCKVNRFVSKTFTLPQDL